MSLDANLDLLARHMPGPILHRIGGEDVDGEGFETRSPTDGSVICKVAKGGEAEIDRAAKAAKAAFPAWRDMPGAERKKLLPATRPWP